MSFFSFRVTRRLGKELIGVSFSRHLIRLWLRNEELAWKIPEHLDANWRRLYYSLTPEQQKFPLDPEIRSASKGIKY